MRSNSSSYFQEITSGHPKPRKSSEVSKVKPPQRFIYPRRNTPPLRRLTITNNFINRISLGSHWKLTGVRLLRHRPFLVSRGFNLQCLNTEGLDSNQDCVLSTARRLGMDRRSVPPPLSLSRPPAFWLGTGTSDGKAPSGSEARNSSQVSPSVGGRNPTVV